MGSAMSETQEELLTSGFSRIVLMLDGDEAGREATWGIAERLMRRTFVKVVYMADGKQPDQLSSEELRSILGSL
jgi:DNA primase